MYSGYGMRRWIYSRETEGAQPIQDAAETVVRRVRLRGCFKDVAKSLDATLEKETIRRKEGRNRREINLQGGAEQDTN